MHLPPPKKEILFEIVLAEIIRTKSRLLHILLYLHFARNLSSDLLRLKIFSLDVFVKEEQT